MRSEVLIYGVDFEQARSGLFALLQLRSEEKDTWPSVKPSPVRVKFL